MSSESSELSLPLNWAGLCAVAVRLAVKKYRTQNGLWGRAVIPLLWVGLPDNLALAWQYIKDDVMRCPDVNVTQIEVYPCSPPVKESRIHAVVRVFDHAPSAEEANSPAAGASPSAPDDDKDPQ
jgi:hypothetical protein